jgi:hypothetical protein
MVAAQIRRFDMRHFWLVLVVLFASGVSRTAAGEPSKKLGDLYVVGIGQEDGWQFLPEGFERVMREQGKAFYRDMHSRTLTGKKATRKELMASLDWVCENAKADDLVFLFIACHGICTRAGESVFATRAGDVRPRDIKAKFAKLPCQAIVVNDACCSGNWAKEFPDDAMPPNLTSLCCCLSTQASVIEFDITLFEALYGKADFNNDGIVDLDEVIKYCGLRIREVQGGKLTPVMHKAKSLKSKLPLTKVAPNLVGVVHKGEVFSALVEKQDGDNYHLRVIGFSDKKGAGLGGYMPSNFTRENIILPKDGAALMVEKDGRWHPARMIGREDKDYKIRYVGAKVDEDVVPADRVRHLFAGNPDEAIPTGLFRRR